MAAIVGGVYLGADAVTPDPPPRFEAFTVVDAVTEGQCRVLVDNETRTSMIIGCARFPAYREVGQELIPYNYDHLYWADAHERGP